MRAVHSIDSCSKLIQMHQRFFLCTDLTFWEERGFALMGHLFFCLSAVPSSREAWNQGVLPNEYQPVLGPGPRGSDRELVKIAASRHAARGGQWIPGSDLEQSGRGWGGWARQPSSLQRPQPRYMSRACCRLSLTASSTEPEQIESGTAQLGRFAGLPYFWGHFWPK